MASQRWFEGRVVELVKRYGERTDRKPLKADATTEEILEQYSPEVSFSGEEPDKLRAVIVYEGEEPALRNVEDTARALQLRVARTEEGDVITPA